MRKSDWINQTSHSKLILSLAVLGFFLLMFGNQVVSLTHPDEVFYTQTAKEMIHYKSWMTPYIFDSPQFEKPILFYWLLIVAIKCFGLTAFVTRFWPAFFGILGGLITYGMAFMLFRNKKIATLSCFILYTSVIYLILSRAVLTDMVFSVWVVLSLASFYYGYFQPEKKIWAIFLCFTFSGVAVLTKGILGVVFPFAVIMGFLFYKRDFVYFKSWATIGGIILFAGIVIPWHTLMLKLYGHRFIDEYLYNVHIRRILEAEHAKSNTWYFYLLTVFTGMFPWSFFLIPMVYGMFQKPADFIRSAQAHQRSSEARESLMFLLIWVTAIYLIMQSAQSKLASYILPAFPPIAILMGYYFSQILESAENLSWGKSIRFISYGLSVLLMLASVASLILAQIYRDLVVHISVVYIFCALALAGAIVLFLFALRREYFGAIVSIGSISFIIVLALLCGHPNAEPWVSCKKISEALKRIDSSDSTILTSKLYVRGVRFYTDRKSAVMDINGEGFFSPHPVPFLNTDEKVLHFLQTQPVTYGILKKSNVDDLKRMAGEKFSVDQLDHIGDKYIVRVTSRPLKSIYPSLH